MTKKNGISEHELDELLQHVAEQTIEPSAGLMSRIIADAGRLVDDREVRVFEASATKNSGVFSGILSALGGWPSLAGLTTATVAGIWIGYASPDTLSVITEIYFATEFTSEIGDFMPTFADVLGEG
ncbi:MAG: hypothetical protein ACU0C9_02455 [Paracoccaceae bacterium]